MGGLPEDRQLMLFPAPVSCQTGLRPMVQSAMGRFVFAVLFTALVGLCAPAGAQPATTPWARGLIVRLKPPGPGAAPAPAGPDATPAARSERAENAARERLARVAQGAGVALRDQRALGAQHRLMRFAQLQHGVALDNALRRMRLHPEVESVEPDVLMKRLSVPSDPDYLTRQWYLQPPATGGVAAINAEQAWDRSTGSANLTVAVLDTGVRLQHPELAGRLWPGHDFVSEVEFAGDGDGRDADPSDPGDWVLATGNPAPVQQLVDADLCDVGASSWHGTFIAGQIGALTDNAQGIAAIGWAPKVLPVRVAGQCGAFLSDLLDGMRWAAGIAVAGAPVNANPARVVNLSFGGDGACTAAYQSAIDDITAAGSLLVVAAGNGSAPLTRPADCQKVLAVGAVAQSGAKASYSSWGPAMGLMAPGGTSPTPTLIWGLDNSGTQGPGADTFGYKLGTSFSAPMAAGVAALMLSVNPALTPSQLVARMRAGARAHVFNPVLPMCDGAALNNSTCNCTTATCGAGLLDAAAAVQLADGPAALIATVGTAVPGGVVTLDGRASVAIPGASITGYQWSQVSGAAAGLDNASGDVATVTLPAVEGSYVFRLVVTDSAGLTGEDVVTVTAVAPIAPVASGGGGASGWLWGLGLWGLWGLAGLAVGVRRAQIINKIGH